MMLITKEVTQLINAASTAEELRNHECFLGERKGIQNTIARRREALEKEQALEEKYVEVIYSEDEILKEHPNTIICGVGKVGRGSLTSPVIVYATILSSSHNYLGLDDSKKVPVTKHLELNEALKNETTAFVYGIVTTEEIDEFSIYKATQIAMQRAIDGLSIQPTHLLIDAMTLDNTLPQVSSIRGDARSMSITVASIMTKVFRDNCMIQLSRGYPGYGFERNAGHGTKQYLLAIDDAGIMEEYRKSFEPIKSLL